jgi:hypothetical protein
VNVLRLGLVSVTMVTIGVGGLVAKPSPAASASPSPPSAVLQELQSRGCKLPRKRSNAAVRGEFFKPGQFDWAALCLAKNGASLLVFPEGFGERVEVLETIPRGFGKWSIDVVSQDRLKTVQPMRGAGGTASIEIDHQGIISFIEAGDREDRCLYCYSAEEHTHYHYQEKWLSLGGVDIN